MLHSKSFGAGIEVELWSYAFWQDAVIDLYFLLDLLLQFRTAFWAKDGMLVTDLARIRSHYLRTRTLCLCFSVSLSVSVSVSVSLSLCRCRFVSLFLSVCLSLSVSLCVSLCVSL